MTLQQALDIYHTNYKADVDFATGEWVSQNLPPIGKRYPDRETWLSAVEKVREDAMKVIMAKTRDFTSSVQNLPGEKKRDFPDNPPNVLER